MTFNLDFNSEETQYINLLNNQIDDVNEYDLTVSGTTGGTVEPTGTTTYPLGTTVPINATVTDSTTHRFKYWLINGIEDIKSLTYVVANKTTTAIANFIKYFSVDISSVGDGISYPIPGSYVYDNGDEVVITATPNEGSEFDVFNINGTETTDNPINITITEDLNIIAFFSRIGTLIMNTFNYGIKKVVDLWYWINDSNSNMVQIKDTQVLTFDGASYVDCGSTLIPSTGDFEVYIDVKIEGSGLYQNLVSQYLSGQAGRMQFFLMSGNLIRLFINGTISIDIAMVIPDLTKENRLGFRRLGNDFTISVDGIDGNTMNSNVSIYQGVNTSIGKYDNSGLPLELEGIVSFFNIVNECTYYFQEGNRVSIKDQSGNGNDGTLIGAVLDTAWGTKSDGAEPVLHQKGGSKYLVCETAGTTTHLASPDGSNIGVENVINGDFSDGTVGWRAQGSGGASVDTSNDTYKYTMLSLGSKVISNDVVLSNNTIYKIEIDIIQNEQPFQLQFVGGSSTKTILDASNTPLIGHHVIYADTEDHNTIRFGYSGTVQMGRVFELDNISVKEVTTIPAYGEWEFKSKLLATNDEVFDVISPVPTGVNYRLENGYSLIIVSNGSILFRRNLIGTENTLFITAAGYIDPTIIHTYKIQRNSIDNEFFTSPANWFRVLIDDVVLDTTNGSGTNPVVDGSIPFISETKFTVLYDEAGNEVSRLSKDGYKYDVANFADVSGSYSVRNSIGLDDGITDVDGNELEYLPNNMWNTGNKYKFPIGTEYSDIQQLQDKGIYIGTEPQEVDWDTVNSLEDDDDITITKDVPNRVITNLKIKE